MNIRRASFATRCRIVTLALSLFVAAHPFAERARPRIGLVPPTAAEDASVPSFPVVVRGRERRVHFEAYGASGLPVMFVAPGSLSDLRAYRPFAAFSDRYRVVLWDMRGNGLSERVGADELSFDAMVEEIRAVKGRFSPDGPVVLVGHSWSAAFAAMYAARYPRDVARLVLIEPPGFRSEYMVAARVPLNLFSVAYSDMTVLQDTLSPTDHEKLDFAALAMLDAAVRDFFVDREKLPPGPVWRVGGYALATWERALVGRRGRWDYDLAEGLPDLPNPTLIAGSSHSPIGYRFQERYALPLFRQARSLRVEGSGHRMVTERWDALERGIRDFLSDSAASENGGLNGEGTGR